jgi:hypothetical protein
MRVLAMDDFPNETRTEYARSDRKNRNPSKRRRTDEEKKDA